MREHIINTSAASQITDRVSLILRRLKYGRRKSYRSNYPGETYIEIDNIDQQTLYLIERLRRGESPKPTLSLWYQRSRSNRDCFNRDNAQSGAISHTSGRVPACASTGFE
jgi:hypothetical protein